MTTTTLATIPTETMPAIAPPVDDLWRRMRASGRIMVGGGILLFMLVTCVATLPWTLPKLAWIQPTANSIVFDNQQLEMARHAPSDDELWLWFGTDVLGRSLLGRSLLGGAI